MIGQTNHHRHITSSEDLSNNMQLIQSSLQHLPSLVKCRLCLKGSQPRGRRENNYKCSQPRKIPINFQQYLRQPVFSKMVIPEKVSSTCLSKIIHFRICLQQTMQEVFNMLQLQQISQIRLTTITFLPIHLQVMEEVPTLPMEILLELIYPSCTSHHVMR